MNKITQIVQRVRSSDNKVAIHAVERLREQGWLERGTLAGANLRYVHLQRANLHKANFTKTDLSMADLRWSNLSGAILRGANLSKANLYAADLYLTNLEGADLIKTNLQGVHNLSEFQLRQTNRMAGTTLPDGSLYDGRYQLSGDLAVANSRHVNLDHPIEKARFYGIYSSPSSARTYSQDLSLMAFTDIQLVRMLRNSDHEVVAQAVYELRRRDRLGSNLLEWTHLKYVHLQGIDLSSANLQKADLSMADLQGANLSHVNLEGARLFRSNLRGCNLDSAILKDALLRGANLQGAYNLCDEQLSMTSTMRGAMMPDGSRYDGRFKLPGDLFTIHSWRIDANNPEALADFYGVSLADYLLGQSVVRNHKYPMTSTSAVTLNWFLGSDVDVYSSDRVKIQE